VSERRKKVALIGYGHIGKRHARVISESKDFELAALIDPHHSDRPGELLPSVLFFKGLEEFIASQAKLPADQQASLAIIATPNGLHETQINRCLVHGLDVVVEKPMALSSQALKALQKNAAAKGLQLFPVVQNRYAKISRWLHQLLREQSLGSIYIIQINCLWNRDERYYLKDSWHGDLALDGGSLYTQFLHFIDMLYWLFGKPSVKAAELFNFNHQALSGFEDSGMIQFAFNQGAAKDALATLTFTTAAWNKNAESSLTILAEKGSIKIGGQYMEKLLYASGSHLPEETELQTLLTKDPDKEKYGPAAGHYQFYEELARHFKGINSDLPTSQEACDVIEIIEQAYKNR
jgi:predicted dehydrogenase